MSMRCPRWGWTRPTWSSALAYRPAAPMPRGRGGPGGVPGVVTMPQVTCGSPSVPRLRWRGRCGRRSSSGTGTSARSTCSWVWSRSIPMSGRCWPRTACRTRCSSAGWPRRAPRDDPRSSRCGGAANSPDHVDLALTKTECQSTRRWAAVSLDDRKLDVLRAIVEDYVRTQEPVGSKTLVDRHHLGVSPATVRNDMAALEEEGFIMQPPSLSRSTVRHVEVVTLSASKLLLVVITSSGRVEQRIIELPSAVDDDVLADLRARLNTAVVGQHLSDAAGRV